MWFEYKEDGQLVQRSSRPVDGERVIESNSRVEHLGDWRVVDGLLVVRENMPVEINKRTILADGVDQLEITAPAGSVLSVIGRGSWTSTATESGYTLSTTTPGTLKVMLRLFPYKDRLIEISAR